ncbi:DUF6415 family natural product biosynthesis protein [Streptomyces sp. NPDC000594]|uniref:DUF6415 family natural product biosynthesis protein n=1 Tax=unclassified Streptomyces TaxID=2593676 RepID=UPI0033184D51
MTYTVLHDPDGLIEATLPLDRAPYECLVTAVLAWPDTGALLERDAEQIALQLTGHAHAVAADVKRRAAALPRDDGRGALADVVLAAARESLATPPDGTVRDVQDRARTVRELYGRLDRLLDAHPADIR